MDKEKKVLEDEASGSKVADSPSPPVITSSESQDTNKENLDFLTKEYQRLKDMRSGGRYVPPAKLRDLEEKLGLHKSPEDLQRARWETLKKSINSLINKVNHNNIKTIVQDIFKLNLIRGRGLFCRSILKAQSLALPYTPVYAALVAIINTKLPIVGELLLTRVILQFKRAFRRNNKQLALSSIVFIAHLCNHQVAHEIIALEILSILLQNPTDDSVELAVAFVKEAGAFLNETSKSAMVGLFDRFREVLHEGTIERRTQYMIEVLFQIRKDNYKDHPIIPKDLDLVDEDEQITHMIGFTDELKAQDTLNVFKFDPNYEKNEFKYDQIKHDILGSSDEESGEEDEEGQDSEEEEEEEEANTANGKPGIKDMTNNELTTLRKNIYLNIMSSMSVDEAAHKLFKIQVPEGKESEIVNMIIETCSQEKIYNKTYGSVANRFCYKSKFWRNLFDDAFLHYYEIIHRYDTNQIRNIATLFGYILAADGLDWEVFEAVHMNERDSTSSSRIFIKLMFEEMKQEMGVKTMVTRFQEEYLQPYLVNLFPKDNKKPEDTRFSINYFTAIGLGVLTEDMRDFLQNMPPPTPSPKGSDVEGSESEYESDRSESLRRRRRRRSSMSDSDDERRVRKVKREESLSRSPSLSPLPSKARLESPEKSTGRSAGSRYRDESPNRTPPRDRDESPSRTPPRDRGSSAYRRYSVSPDRSPSSSPDRYSRSRGREKKIEQDEKRRSTRYDSRSRPPHRRYPEEHRERRRRRRRRSDSSYDSEKSEDEYSKRREFKRQNVIRKRKRDESDDDEREEYSRDTKRSADRYESYKSRDRDSSRDNIKTQHVRSRDGESHKDLQKSTNHEDSHSSERYRNNSEPDNKPDSVPSKSNDSRRRGRAAAVDYL